MLQKMSDMPILASSLNMGLVILSPDFHVAGMNEYAKKILSPAMEDLGKNILHYHPRKSHEKAKGLLKKVVSLSRGLSVDGAKER
ncbi:MAG TPA: hypothetical protein VLH56_10405 [Dissulfurispiraceae bacterium]|nr:hypothetical protein [Dissulfurispiraceae bacterium]